jgi:hypothetical protein
VPCYFDKTQNKEKETKGLENKTLGHKRHQTRYKNKKPKRVNQNSKKPQRMVNPADKCG